MAGSAATRVTFASVEGAAPIFTPAFLDYLVELHDRFTPRIAELLIRRAEALRKAHAQGALPTSPAASTVTGGDWRVPSVPATGATGVFLSCGPSGRHSTLLLGRPEEFFYPTPSTFTALFTSRGLTQRIAP